MSTRKLIDAAFRLKKLEAKHARRRKALLDAASAFIQQVEMGQVTVPQSKWAVLGKRMAPGDRRFEASLRGGHQYRYPIEITRVRRIEPENKYKPHVGIKQRTRHAPGP